MKEVFFLYSLFYDGKIFLFIILIFHPFVLYSKKLRNFKANLIPLSIYIQYVSFEIIENKKKLKYMKPPKNNAKKLRLTWPAQKHTYILHPLNILCFL